jgi:hypothetical protein
MHAPIYFLEELLSPRTKIVAWVIFEMTTQIGLLKEKNI